MADNLTTATIDVRANTRGMERDILKALQTVELSQINTKKSSQALGRITGQVSEFNKSLEASNARVVAFGASAGAIFAVEKALTSLISSTVNVQKQLADVNVLLNLSSSSLEKFGSSLFDIARNTAQSFSEVATAATELSRQGLGVEETLKRTNAALILTRLSGLDAKSSVEALTATLNSFSGSALDAVEVVNKLANVDAAFAVSSADLANAISRVGSTAVDAGVSLDELIALVTSAQQTTARGGAVIGNSFKTIFTRLQRGKVQDLLGSLGVDTGEGQSAISLLQQLASTYDTLGASQKSYVAEQVGGVFQINILKAALSDLGKEYSIYGRALDTSLSSTDEAIRRNELLNKTVSALSSQTVASLEQAANKIGSIVFEPNAKGFLSGFNNLLESFNNIDAESAGGKLMTGFFKGIGDFIGGPGAVLATAVLVKLFAKLGQFAAGSAKELLGTNKAAQQQVAIEQSILSILQKNSQFTSQILAGKMTTVQAEKQMLDYLTAQSNILREQERLSKVIGANLAMKGVSVGASGIPMTAPAKKTKVAASGYIPNFATDMAVGQAMESAGAREHGYKAGKARKTTIHDGNGKSFKSFVNNKEDVKTFTNAAGKKATIVRPPNGFGENTQYAASGFIPNFVNIGSLDKFSSIDFKLRKSEEDAKKNKSLPRLDRKDNVSLVGGKLFTQYEAIKPGESEAKYESRIIKQYGYDSNIQAKLYNKGNSSIDGVKSEGGIFDFLEVKAGGYNQSDVYTKMLRAIPENYGENNQLDKWTIGRDNFSIRGLLVQGDNPKQSSIIQKRAEKAVGESYSYRVTKGLGTEKMNNYVYKMGSYGNKSAMASGFVPNFAAGVITGDALRGNEYKAALEYVANSNKPVRTILGPSGSGKTTRAVNLGGKIVNSFSELNGFDSYILDRASLDFPKDEKVTANLKKIFSRSSESGSLDVLMGSRSTISQLRNKRAEQGDKIVPNRAQLPTGSGGVASFIMGIRGFKSEYPQANVSRIFKSGGGYENRQVSFGSGFIPNFASMGSKFKAMYGGGTTMRAVDKEKSAKKKNLDVKKLDLSDRYTMVHGGNQGLDSANVSLEAGNNLFDAKIATAGLDTAGTNLQRYGIKGVVGDALVGATNNIIKTFGGKEQITDASSLDNAGSVGSAAGTVFETALRKAFNAPAVSQTQRIDFPAPTPELKKFFHNAPGQYEAKISRTPDNLKSTLKKWVDVNGLASSASGYIPNFAKSGLSYSYKDKDEFGFSEIQAIMSGKKVGSFSYAEDKKGEVDVGDFSVNKGERGKGIGSGLYKEAIRRNAGKKMRGQLLPQMNRLLQKIKNGEPVSAETLYPQIKRADLAKSSMFEVYGHKGMTVEKMTRDQFSSFVNAKINELKKDPKKLQSYFGNVEADEYGGLGVDLQTQHASGFVPNFADQVRKNMYDWDGTIIPKIRGGSADYIRQLGSLKEKDLLPVGKKLKAGKKKFDVLTSRPPLFEKAIRETSSRLGLPVNKISFGVKPKDKLVEAQKRGSKIVDDNLDLMGKPGFLNARVLNKRLSSGFVPNFEGPLSDAIVREQSSGLSKSQIYVDSHSSLKNKNNPMGLMVANRRDEPGGGIQGIKRAKKEGRNPKTYGGGMSSGFIPNFAETGSRDDSFANSTATITAALQSLALSFVFLGKEMREAGKAIKEGKQGIKSFESEVQNSTQNLKRLEGKRDKRVNALADDRKYVNRDKDVKQAHAGAFAAQQKRDKLQQRLDAKKVASQAAGTTVNANYEKMQQGKINKAQSALDEANKKLTAEKQRVGQYLRQSVSVINSDITATRNSISEKNKQIENTRKQIKETKKQRITSAGSQLGMMAQIAAPQISSMMSEENRGGKAIVEAAGNIAGFAGIGVMMGGHWGAAAGALAGLAMEVPKIEKAFKSKLPEFEKALDLALQNYNKFGESGQGYLAASEKFKLAKVNPDSKASDLITIEREYLNALSKLPAKYQNELTSAEKLGAAQETYAQILKELAKEKAGKEIDRNLTATAEGSQMNIVEEVGQTFSLLGNSANWLSASIGTAVSWFDKMVGFETPESLNPKIYEDKLLSSTYDRFNGKKLGKDKITEIASQTFDYTKVKDDKNTQNLNESLESALQLQGGLKAIYSGVMNPMANTGFDDQKNALINTLREGFARSEGVLSNQELSILEKLEKTINRPDEMINWIKSYSQENDNFINSLEKVAEFNANIEKNKQAQIQKRKDDLAARSERGARLSNLQNSLNKAFSGFSSSIENVIDSLRFNQDMSQASTEFRRGFAEQAGFSAQSKKIELNLGTTKIFDEFNIKRLESQQQGVESLDSAVEPLISALQYNNLEDLTGTSLSGQEAQFGIGQVEAQSKIFDIIKNFASTGFSEEGSGEAKSQLNTLIKESIKNQFITEESGTKIINAFSQESDKQLNSNLKREALLRQQLAQLAQQTVLQRANQKLLQAQKFGGGTIEDIFNPDQSDTAFGKAIEALQGLKTRGYSAEKLKVDPKTGKLLDKQSGAEAGVSKENASGILQFYKAASQFSGGVDLADSGSADFENVRSAVQKTLQDQMSSLIKAAEGVVDPATLNRMSANSAGLGGMGTTSFLKTAQEMGVVKGGDAIEAVSKDYADSSFAGLPKQLKDAYTVAMTAEAKTAILNLAATENQTSVLAGGLDNVVSSVNLTTDAISLLPEAMAAGISSAISISRKEEAVKTNAEKGKEIGSEVAATTEQMSEGGALKTSKAKAEAKIAESEELLGSLGYSKKSLDQLKFSKEQIDSANLNLNSANGLDSASAKELLRANEALTARSQAKSEASYANNQLSALGEKKGVLSKQQMEIQGKGVELTKEYDDAKNKPALSKEQSDKIEKINQARKELDSRVSGQAQKRSATVSGLNDKAGVKLPPNVKRAQDEAYAETMGRLSRKIMGANGAVLSGGNTLETEAMGSSGGDRSKAFNSMLNGNMEGRIGVPSLKNFRDIYENLSDQTTAEQEYAEKFRALTGRTVEQAFPKKKTGVTGPKPQQAEQEQKKPEAEKTQDPSQLISNILTTVNQIAAELQKQVAPNTGTNGQAGTVGAVSVSTPVNLSINSTAGENKTEVASVADQIKNGISQFFSSPEFLERVTTIAKTAAGNPPPPKSRT